MSVLRHVLVVVIALIVYHLIQSYLVTKDLKPQVNGYFHPAFRKVAETFRENLESGLEYGASFSVYRQGEVLVDLWGGWADLEAERPWAEDTFAMSFSMVKGVSAIAIGTLVDKGLLDYKKEVYHYWPEFGTKDKRNITVEMLLSHQAGLLLLDEQVKVHDYENNWPKVEKILADQAPQWPPGTAVGYHTWTWGMYADALVRKVDPKHRNMSEYFRQEIAEPFDIEFYIGLPRSLYHRFARFHTFSILDQRVKYEDLIPEVFGTFLYKAAYSCDATLKVEHMLRPDYLQVGIPSAMGFGSARQLAKLFDYVANGGTVKGKRLLSESTVKLLRESLTDKLPRMMFSKAPFSRGVSVRYNSQGHQMIGHSGYGGSYSFADTTIGVGVSYSTNHMSFYHKDDPRQVTLRDAFYEGYDKYLQSINKQTKF